MHPNIIEFLMRLPCVKDDFQLQYAAVELDKIIWQKLSFSANEIINCTYYHGFQPWFNGVVARVDSFETDGWLCIDIRQNIREHWAQKKTWLMPPIFIYGTLIHEKNSLHLVEGYTRVGLLKGLVKKGVISGESKHVIWYGNY